MTVILLYHSQYNVRNAILIMERQSEVNLCTFIVPVSSHYNNYKLYTARICIVCFEYNCSSGSRLYYYGSESWIARIDSISLIACDKSFKNKNKHMHFLNIVTLFVFFVSFRGVTLICV